MNCNEIAMAKELFRMILAGWLNMNRIQPQNMDYDKYTLAAGIEFGNCSSSNMKFFGVHIVDVGPTLRIF